MSALLQWGRAYLDAVLQWLREPVATAFNLLALGCAFGLALAALVWLGEASLGRAGPGDGRLAPEVTLILRAGTGESVRTALQRRIEAERGVREVRFIGREAALARLADDLGDRHLLDGLGENPLPDALVVRLVGDLPAARSARLVEQWRDLGPVEQVLADHELVERLRRVGGTLRLMAQAVVVLLLTSGAVVVFNTIRLQLSGRQQEIELLRLLGAPADFVQRPFIARGTLLAVTAAGLGWGLAEGLVRVVAGWAGPLASAWGLATPPLHVPLQAGLTLLGVATTMGWLTARLGVSRHLASTDRR
jgi:cell division transport system permease protein